MRIYFLSLLLCAWPMFAQADVVIRGTRIIYDEARGETNVPIRQLGDGPKLVQVWLDAGDDSIEPGKQEVPFLLTPAVTRMNPDTGQTIRILRVDDGLPQDRESLFWFNTLEVPPSPTKLIENGDNFIQFASRIRLKFFYRPKGLQPDLEKSIDLLRFSLSDAQTPEGYVQVDVRNASPYHITFRDLTLRPDAGEDAPTLAELVSGDWMVEPMGERRLVLQYPPESSKPPRLPDNTQVAFGIVNDYGSVIAGQQPLGTAK